MFRKLKKGRDREGEWGKNDDKVMQAVEDGDIERLQAALGKRGTSPVKMDPDGRVPLHLAAELGQFGCLDFMIQQGATVAAADSQGYTVLHYSATGGHTDCVQRLVLAQAPLNAKELTGKTALHLSVHGGHTDCCRILLKAKVAVDAKEEYGKTPLLIAAHFGHLAICKDLIDKGANVNAQDHLQRTPLMLACEHRHLEVSELLVKRGALTGLTDAQGLDATHYALESGDEDLQKCLEAAPSVATWDVRGHDESDDEHRPDSVDYVDNFDALRCESPVPRTPPQKNGSLHKLVVENQQAALATKSAMQSKEMKEMEEENEVLFEELSRVTTDYKKGQDKIKLLEQQLQAASMGHGDNQRNQEFEEEFENLKRSLQAERDKRAKAEGETEMLKARLMARGGDMTEDDTEIDSNWGDSDDDLFDLPGLGGPKGKPGKRSDTPNRLGSESTGLVAILRSQIVSLRQENEELKKKSLGSNAGELDDSRVSQLEEEVLSLQEELDGVSGRDVVSVEEYDELKEANRLEMEEYRKNNSILMDEIANMSQRLAVSTDENERLKRKSTLDSRKTPTRGLSANSALQRQCDNLLHDKQELRESVARLKQSQAEWVLESEQLKVRIQELSEDNGRLREDLSAKTQSGPSAEEHEALMEAVARLESTVAKQSKAIVQQNDRARREKQTQADLRAERDSLQEDLSELREAMIDKDLYDDLVDENHRLQQSVRTQEEIVAGSPARDHLDQLTTENWRLQDEIRKQDDEVVRLRRELLNGQHQPNGHADGQEDLPAQNRALRDRVDMLEQEAARAGEDASKRSAELLAQNQELQRRMQEQAQTFESHLPASVGFSKKRYTELLTENRKLKAQLQEPGPVGSPASTVEDLKEVIRLQQKLQEAETKHTKVVTIYRSHLLSSIQNDLHPKVRDALTKISKIQHGEEFV